YYFSIDARHVIKTVRIGKGGHFCQIVIALFIFCQHYYLIAIVLNILVSMIPTYKEFTSNDGGDRMFGKGLPIYHGFPPSLFYPRIVGLYLLNEMKGPHPIGMVGQGYCSHVLLCRRSYQIPNVDGGL